MLKRIFRTILVLSLILGIAIPSNAAVSVSDGSAFVSKAEFSADLNNLSNRMAQLENSLDAKIDSLVSSYLTRNGIWNGAVQNVQNSYFVDCFGENITGSGATMIYSHQFPSNITAGSNAYFINTTKLLVDGFTKTGLCLLTIDAKEIGAGLATDGRSYTYYTYPNPNGSSSWNLYHLDRCALTFEVDDGNSANRREVGRIKTYQTSYETIDSEKVLAFKTVPGVSNIYFFVSKEEKLYWHYIVGITVMSAGAAYGLKGKNPTPNIIPSSIRCNFTECSVY